jgi:hypothetical protein
MLDMHDDGPIALQKEDIVGKAPGEPLDGKRCRQAVRLGDGT